MTEEDPEREEIPVYEARRAIGSHSYDDNWNLKSYTAELRNKRDDSFFAFVDFNEETGEGTIKYCPHCLQFELKHKLGHKIKKKGEPPAPDDEQWLSCYECGRTYPVHETFTESKIKDSLETTDNPFEGNESTFLSTDSRATQRRKGKKPRSKRLKVEEHEDPDIQAEQKRHGSDNVHIIK